MFQKKTPKLDSPATPIDDSSTEAPVKLKTSKKPLIAMVAVAFVGAAAVTAFLPTKKARPAAPSTNTPGIPSEGGYTDATGSNETAVQPAGIPADGPLPPAATGDTEIEIASSVQADGGLYDPPPAPGLPGDPLDPTRNTSSVADQPNTAAALIETGPAPIPAAEPTVAPVTPEQISASKAVPPPSATALDPLAAAVDPAVVALIESRTRALRNDLAEGLSRESARLVEVAVNNVLKARLDGFEQRLTALEAGKARGPTVASIEKAASGAAGISDIASTTPGQADKPQRAVLRPARAPGPVAVSQTAQPSSPLEGSLRDIYSVELGGLPGDTRASFRFVGEKPMPKISTEAGGRILRMQIDRARFLVSPPLVPAGLVDRVWITKRGEEPWRSIRFATSGGVTPNVTVKMDPDGRHGSINVVFKRGPGSTPGIVAVDNSTPDLPLSRAWVVQGVTGTRAILRSVVTREMQVVTVGTPVADDQSGTVTRLDPGGAVYTSQVRIGTQAVLDASTSTAFAIVP